MLSLKVWRQSYFWRCAWHKSMRHIFLILIIILIETYSMSVEHRTKRNGKNSLAREDFHIVPSKSCKLSTKTFLSFQLHYLQEFNKYYFVSLLFSYNAYFVWLHYSVYLPRYLKINPPKSGFPPFSGRVSMSHLNDGICFIRDWDISFQVISQQLTGNIIGGIQRDVYWTIIYYA